MVNFRQIAEDCLSGKLSGTFVLRNGGSWKSNTLSRYSIEGKIIPDYYVLGKGLILDSNGLNMEIKERVQNFIPDNMPEQIKIDVPEGKVPVMERTEKGVFITWKEKEITYADVISKLVLSQNAIYEFWSDKIHKGESSTFYKKVEVLRKLTNIRNYFGKPDKKNSDSGWVICINGTVYRAIVAQNSHVPVFAEKEHAEQAIKMLGDELKCLFEPW